MLRKALLSFQFRSLLLKISICLCVLVVLPIIFICIFGNWYSQRVIQEEIDKSSLQILDQTRRLMDYQLNDIDSFSVQLANSDPVTEAVEIETLTQMEPLIHRVQYYLRDFYISSPYIDSIYIYYKNLNMIQSAITGLQSVEEFEQKDILRIFEKMDKKRKWLFSESIEKENINKSSSKVTLIRPIPLTGDANSGAIIVNLNQQVLFQSPSAQLMREGEEIWMIHPSGKYGFETRQGKSLTSTDLSELSSKINKEMTTFRAQFRDEKYSFTSVTSPQTGWKYIYLVPTKTLYSFSEVIKWFMVLLSTISIIVSIVFAIIISKRIYNPIQSLIKVINVKLNEVDLNGNVKDKGEFPYIMSAIEQFSQKEKNLEEQLQKNYPVLRQNFINNLLHERTDKHQERLIKLHKYGIQFTSYGYFVGVLRIDNYPEFIKQNNDLDQSLLRYFIQKVSEEVIIDEFHVLSVNTESSDVILICNLKTNMQTNEVQNSALTILKTISHHISFHLDITITIGIGQIVGTTGDISNSYQTAIEALELRAYKGNGSIVASWQIQATKTIDTSIFEKRKEIEESIFVALKGANFSIIIEKIDEFFIFIKRFQTYPYSLIQHNVLDLLTSIVQKTLELGLKVDLEQEFSTLYTKVIGFETLNQLETWVNDYIHKLIGSLENELKQVVPDVTEQILEYIQTNYNKEISLNGIADKLSLDPSYISRLFKQKVGMNFMEYLISLRLNSAKEMLKNNTLSVKEIGQSVGYYNTHSFIRIFKKYEGITPGKYREKQDQKLLDIKEIY
ncbi:helix-turn-helix domain-containing protein [Metabacillus bambusae]|uniref:AraC family transcriptional regulator n=1 Tax=Metabacillus bambusae TaxID=2795218 RepID=A0ABS3N767_9BACI|nr:helix-turn-helix domain-containing protein [Metabacillus bambusae]MBO1514132.1 AraC family transcriptional regulator [Metabacillus bambusae]